MRALEGDKPKVRVFTDSEPGQSKGFWKGILKHIEIQRFKRGGLGTERFITLGESDQMSVRWRASNVVHTFTVASVLSGLDFVRIEVEVQKVLQGLRVAKKNQYARRSQTWRVGEGGKARRTHDSRRYGGEIDLV
jgi:hypothetical protein